MCFVLLVSLSCLLSMERGERREERGKGDGISGSFSSLAFSLSFSIYRLYILNISLINETDTPHRNRKRTDIDSHSIPPDPIHHSTSLSPHCMLAFYLCPLPAHTFFLLPLSNFSYLPPPPLRIPINGLKISEKLF